MSIQDAGADKTPSRFRSLSTVEPWTAERIARLTELYAQGLSYTKIVAALGGTTKGSVAGKISALRLTREKPKVSSVSPKEKSDARTAGVAARLKRAKAPVGPAPELERHDCFLGIAFLDLDEHHCRFPHGDGRDTLFCGQPKKDDSSYCPHHHKITHNGIPSSRPSAAEKRIRAQLAREMEHDVRRSFP